MTRYPDILGFDPKIVPEGVAKKEVLALCLWGAYRMWVKRRRNQEKSFLSHFDFCEPLSGEYGYVDLKNEFFEDASISASSGRARTLDVRLLLDGKEEAESRHASSSSSVRLDRGSLRLGRPPEETQSEDEDAKMDSVDLEPGQRSTRDEAVRRWRIQQEDKIPLSKQEVDIDWA